MSNSISLMTPAEVAGAQETQEIKEREPERGPSGEVGKPTTSLTLKQKWHEANFRRVDVGDKRNPRKRTWVKNHGAVSLKQFAKALAASGDILAKDWFESKDGALNESRSDKNKTRIAAEKLSSKQARRKKSAGKQSKADEAASATTATPANMKPAKGKKG